MDNNDFIRLNAAIIPSVYFYDLAVDLSQEISRKYNTHFTLNNENTFPHISVYPPEYPVENINKVHEQIKKVANKHEPFSLGFSKVGGSRGWVSIDFSKNNELEQLHTELVEVLNPLREGHLRAKYHEKDYLVGLNEEQINTINTYGYPGVLQNYMPHLTVARLVDESDYHDVNEYVKSRIKENNMPVSTLGIHRSGKHGTVIEVLYRIGLD